MTQSELVEREVDAMIEMIIDAYHTTRLSGVLAAKHIRTKLGNRLTDAIHATLSQPWSDAGWLPIESAPKDGTGILVVDMKASEPAVGTAWFINGAWTGDDPEVPRGDDFCTSIWPSPTHWRHYPPAPDELQQPPAAREEGLAEAAKNLIAVRSDTYQARNGRRCSIEGDDGEKCWIIPFEAMNELEKALRSTLSPSPSPDQRLVEAAVEKAIKSARHDGGCHIYDNPTDFGSPYCSCTARARAAIAAYEERG